MRIRLLMLLAALVLLPLPAPAARIARPSLALLVRSAHVIVVAEVEKIWNEEAGVEVAAARVLEVWKGSPGGEVLFRASRKWACDISSARKGERVVLFLTESPGSPVMSITYHGWGRLPITYAAGRASLFAPIPIEHDPGARAGGVPSEQGWIGSAEITVFKGLVERLMVLEAKGAG